MNRDHRPSLRGTACESGGHRRSGRRGARGGRLRARPRARRLRAALRPARRHARRHAADASDESKDFRFPGADTIAARRVRQVHHLRRQFTWPEGAVPPQRLRERLGHIAEDRGRRAAPRRRSHGPRESQRPLPPRHLVPVLLRQFVADELLRDRHRELRRRTRQGRVQAGARSRQGVVLLLRAGGSTARENAQVRAAGGTSADRERWTSAVPVTESLW